MIPRRRRLTKGLFDDVMSGARPSHSALFVIRYVKSEGPSRFSVTVPKKIAKSAVSRNKLRRRAYSALYPLLPKVKDGIHGVLVGKSTILNASLDDISKDLINFFGKSDFLK